MSLGRGIGQRGGEAGRMLVGEEHAAPGVGEEPLVALRSPATLADQQLVELSGVGGPDDVSGLVGV